MCEWQPTTFGDVEGGEVFMLRSDPHNRYMKVATIALDDFEEVWVWRKP